MTTKPSLNTLNTVRQAIWDLQDALAQQSGDFEYLRRRRHLFGLEDNDGDICWPNVDNRIQLLAGSGITIDAQPDAHTITMTADASAVLHSSLGDLQGGDSGADEYYHLNYDEYIAIRTVDSLTASRLVATNAAGVLESVADITAYDVGVSQYEVLFGDGAQRITQSANLAFYGRRLAVDSEVEITSTLADPILTLNFPDTTDARNPRVVFEENSVGIASMGIDTSSSNVFVLSHTADLSTTDFTLNSQGHFGISVVADASWSYQCLVLQVGSQAAFFTTSAYFACLGTNTYYDGSDWKYLVTDEASLYNQDSGKHQFYVASSGTEDNTISWTAVLRLTNGGEIECPNISADTDDTVVVLNSSGYLKTDEINSQVWNTGETWAQTSIYTSLSDTYMPKWDDGNTEFVDSLISDDGTDITLHVSNQEYIISNRNDYLTLQGQNDLDYAGLEIYTADGDGSDVVAFRLYTVGTPDSVTNNEWFGLVANISVFELTSQADGTGTLRPIEIYTEGNDNQIYLGTGGAVGINTNSPSAKLSVNGGVHVGGTSDPGDNNIVVDGTVQCANIGADTDDTVVVLNSSGYLKTDEINSQVWNTGETWAQTSIYTSLSDTYIPYWNDGNSRLEDSPLLRDSNGNIGFGADPPDWHSDYDAIAFSGEGSLAYGTPGFIMISNAYYDATNTRWEYVTAAEASYYNQSTGRHLFFTAVAGTNPGDEISWIQAMRINNNGFVGYGGDPSYRFHLFSGTVDHAGRFESSDDLCFLSIKDDDTTGYVCVQDAKMSIGHETDCGGGSAFVIKQTASGRAAAAIGAAVAGWDHNSSSLQVGAQATLIGHSTSTIRGCNVYYDSGYKYVITDEACYYYQGNGRHDFYTASSGTAGNTLNNRERRFRILNDGTVVVTSNDLQIDSDSYGLVLGNGQDSRDYFNGSHRIYDSDINGAGSQYHVFYANSGATRIGIGGVPTEALDVTGNAKVSGTVQCASIGADTDDTVVVLNGSGYLKTDEINSQVWNTGETWLTSVAGTDMTGFTEDKLAVGTAAGGLESAADLDWDGADLNIDGEVFIADTNHLIVGNGSSVTTGYENAFQVLGTNSAWDSRQTLGRFSEDGGSPGLDFLKSRSGTIGSNGCVNNGDTVGQIWFRADDGTDYASQAALIKVSIDGAAGANDTPGKIEFKTTADGNASTTTALTIDSSQAIQLNAYGVGVLHSDASGNITSSTVDISTDTNLAAGTHLSLSGDTINCDVAAGSHLSYTGDTLNVSDDWYDSVGDIPTATPNNGDTTHLSTADQIYDWVTGLGYLASVAGSDMTGFTEDKLAVGTSGGGLESAADLDWDGSRLWVNGDVEFGGETVHMSSAQILEWQHSLVTRQYVSMRDDATVKSGTLTHVDNDDQGDNAIGVWGDGRFVYLANYDGGLHVYSVSDAGVLTHVDFDDQGDNAYDVWGDGRFVYLANDTGGLHVYSVDSSGTLTHVDSDDQGNSARGVWGDGRFVYLANEDGGLHVYSVSDAGVLTHVDSDDQGDKAYDVWGDGRFVYLANHNGGLHVYSVDSSGTLTHVDSDDQGGSAYGVWGDGRFVYLANYTDGLHVYSIENAYEYDRGAKEHTFRTSGSAALTIDSSQAIQLNAYGEGLLHSDASGNITSSGVVGGDLSGFTEDKLAVGTAAGGLESAADLDWDGSDLNIDGNVYMVSGNRMVVGNDSGVTTVQENALQVLGTNSAWDSRITLGRFSEDNSAPGLSFLKSRSSTIGSNGCVSDGDRVGQIWFRVDDGTDYLSLAAQIKVSIDGAAGANDTPGKIEFETTADGSNSPTTALTIDSAQDSTFSGAVILDDRFIYSNKTAVGAGGIDVANAVEQSVTGASYFTVDPSDLDHDYYKFTDGVDGQQIIVKNLSDDISAHIVSASGTACIGYPNHALLGVYFSDESNWVWTILSE